MKISISIAINSIRSGLSKLARLRALGNLTFYKNYFNATSSNADLAIGSSTGTMTVTRGASNPATTVTNTTSSEVTLVGASPFFGSSSTEDNEIWDMVEFQGNLYIGYYSAGRPGCYIYKWDGTTFSQFYTIGFGSKYTQCALGVLNDKLYAGVTGASIANADIWAYDPTTASPTNCLMFSQGSGTSGRINIPTTANNQIFGSTAFSIEWKGNPFSSGGGSVGRIVDKTRNSNFGYSLLFTASGFVQFNIFESGTQKTTTTNNLAVTYGQLTDTHVAVSWTSGSAPKIYINGTEATYGTSTIVTTPGNDTSEQLSVGNDNGNTFRGFDGQMKRLRIWNNYALTPANVTTLNGGGAVAGVTAEYLFTEGSGVTVADSSGNGNTGTIETGIAIGLSVAWNNTAWTRVYSEGTSNDHNGVFTFQNYKGKIYAGFGYGASDGDIYESSDGSTWSLSRSGSATEPLVERMIVYKGNLYAAIGGSSNGNAKIAKFDGSTWTDVFDGTGLGLTYQQACAFTIYNNTLYAGMLGTSLGDAVVYSTTDGSSWTLFYSDSTGNRVHSLATYNGNLYIGIANIIGSLVKYDGSTFSRIKTFTEKELFFLYTYKNSLMMGLGFTYKQANLYSYTEKVPQVSTITTSNTPRLVSGYWNSSGYQAQSGILVEDSHANLILQSNTFTNASWTKTSTAVYGDSVVTPDGVNAYNNAVYATAINGTLGQAVTGASVAYTFSIWLKRANGTGTVSITADGTNYTDITSSLSTNYWVRVTDTRTALNPTPGIKISVSGDGVYVYGAQLEANTYATSYIPTTTASLTRNAETLTYPVASNRTAATETIAIKFRPLGGSFANDLVIRHLLDSDIAGAKEARTVRKEAAGTVLKFYPNFTTNVLSVSTGSTTNAADTSYVFTGVAYGAAAATNSEIYSNGVSQGTDTNDYAAPALGANFEVGASNAGTGQLNGIIESVTVYSDAKNATDVSKIASILNEAGYG